MCSGAGRCVEMSCQCVDGFSGVDCSVGVLLFPCPNNCTGHGECLTHPGYCTCVEGYTGIDCSEIKPCPNGCSNHGLCSEGRCICDSPFGGDDCANQLIPCLSNCSSHGACVNGSCICHNGYTGDSCEFR